VFTCRWPPLPCLRLLVGLAPASRHPPPPPPPRLRGDRGAPTVARIIPPCGGVTWTANLFVMHAAFITNYTRLVINKLSSSSPYSHLSHPWTALLLPPLSAHTSSLHLRARHFLTLHGKQVVVLHCKNTVYTNV
jgi:hypothetical protein